MSKFLLNEEDNTFYLVREAEFIISFVNEEESSVICLSFPFLFLFVFSSPQVFFYQ